VGSSGLDSVREGEECIRTKASALGLVSSMVSGVANRVKTVGLATSNTDGGSALNEHNSIRFNVLGSEPSESKLLKLLLGRLDLRDYLPGVLLLNTGQVIGLYQETTKD
jgi:hypothetical protein